MKNSQNPATILLIENNSDWSADVYLVLQEAGYNVLTATGGDAGFCTARCIRPDLIICEDALPDISGIQLCYMIRADKNLQSALFILMGESNGRSRNTILEGFRAGADEYLEKTCNRDFLTAKITKLIALKRSNIQLRERCHNLQRSELRLMKTIQEIYDLIATLNLSAESINCNERNINESKKVSSKSFKFNMKENANVFETWKPSLQVKELTDIDDLYNM